MNYTELTSRKNPTVLQAAALSADKKSRDSTRLFAAEGVKLFGEALDAHVEVEAVFFTQKARTLYGELLERVPDARLFLVTDEVYAKLSTETAPQGIYACLRKPLAGRLDSAALRAGDFVMLDGLQNPANLGAILRSAFALGFHRLLLTDTCADLYAPKCVRAAMGSVFRFIPYFTSDLAGAIRVVRAGGKRVFCAALGGNSVRLGTFAFQSGDSFVIGNEGHGVSQRTADACSHRLFIPMCAGAESLNAASAAALVMWEMKKDMLLACSAPS